MKEYILCAANWFDDGQTHEHQPLNVSNGYVVCGQRHHNCFMTVAILKGNNVKDIDYDKCTQGFLTSSNMFVNRKEAGLIAFEAGQIKEPTDCLFSEDLY